MKGWIMTLLWKIGYRLYNWCEDRRPAGGWKRKGK